MMALLPKLTYRFKTTTIKIPARFFADSMEIKRTQNRPNNLEKKNKVEDSHFPVSIDIQINGIELKLQK